MCNSKYLRRPPVGRARLDRGRDGLLVFFVGVVLLSVATAVYLLTNLVVAAAPVVMLASGITIARLEKLTLTAQRVLGRFHPIVGGIVGDLVLAREALRAPRRRREPVSTAN